MIYASDLDEDDQERYWNVFFSSGFLCLPIEVPKKKEACATLAQAHARYKIYKINLAMHNDYLFGIFASLAQAHARYNKFTCPGILGGF